MSDWTLSKNKPKQSQFAGLRPEIRSTKPEILNKTISASSFTSLQVRFQDCLPVDRAAK